MQGRLAKNITANISQQIINQVFGLVIFYVLSTKMDKAAFGQLNWCLAFLLTGFAILSFGIDQLAIKKIAGGADPGHVVSVFIAHVIVAGLLFYGMIAIASFCMPGQMLMSMLLLLGIGKLMIFFTLPFKQVAAGLEQFNVYARMSVVSNIVRGIALIIGSLFFRLSLQAIIIIFVVGDLLELLVCIYLYARRLKSFPISTANWQAYAALLKEALPQIGVVLSTAAMSRFDWLFIGLVVSATKLAEYSFAYKVYEMAMLPLLIIAPLLIPRFVKHFQKDQSIDGAYAIVQLEMIICSLIIVVLNLVWAPLTDALTQNKYGAVNSRTIFLLSLSTPLLYVNNVLWTIAFAKGKLAPIFRIIFITCCINIIADLILIPFFTNEGAALACLLALLVQTWLYAREEKHFSFVTVAPAVIGYPVAAVFCICIAHYATANVWYALIIGVFLYSLLMLIAYRFVKTDFRNGIRMLRPEL